MSPKAVRLTPDNSSVKAVLMAGSRRVPDTIIIGMNDRDPT